MLGAGASLSAGCPLMHGFIDRARDYLELGRFSEQEAKDVQAALNLYQALRARFNITEENIENVENLLSLADLSRLIESPPISELSDPELSDSLRRFIDVIVSKSVSVASPTSPEWLERKVDGPFVFKQLVRALAYQGSNVTVLTTNYDCLVEYTCYCLGIPFTYNRELGDGIEILKLHGSSNWLQCSDVSCEQHKKVRISAIDYKPHDLSSARGYIGREESQCEICGKRLTPVIVPPTWAKEFDSQTLRKVWSGAVRALSQADAFVVVGFSLPVSDAHIRHLLHVGFSSGELIHALAVVGPDELSAERWNSLFRESWRQVRLEVHQTTFERAVDPAILPALIVPNDYATFAVQNAPMLAIPIGPHPANEIFDKLNVIARQQGLPTGGSWSARAQGLRDNSTNNPAHAPYQTILKNEGLDWSPKYPILPTHGNSLA
jgi:NAD-dependent SIR2 family protein deacetylase